MQNIIVQKSGMTRFFIKNYSVPVTVLYLIENIIVNVFKKNNTNKIQVTVGNKNENKINKSILNIYKKKNIKSGIKLWELNNYLDNYNNLNIGKSIDFSFLKNVSKVNITGISKGKGFCGVIKRWNFKLQDSSHGNSLSHRAPGSIGQNQSPGRVFKNKKMAGHYGCEKITIKNLKIINIDLNNKFLLIKGSCPGKIGSNLILK